ncbi:MAG TPA: glycosyltransferase family 9 protein, partial [bacterium]
MPTFEKILILRPRFLGDLILATGLADILKQDKPQTQVWFLTESPYAEALQNHPKVDGVLSLDVGKKNNPFYLWSFLREIRRQKFDAVLDLFGNPRTSRMAFLSGIPTRVGFDLRGRAWAYNVIAKTSSAPLPSGRRLVTETYRDQARALGFSSPRPYQTSLFVTEEEKGHA